MAIIAPSLLSQKVTESHTKSSVCAVEPIWFVRSKYVLHFQDLVD